MKGNGDMEKKLTVDRIEEGIAVCFDENGRKFEISDPLAEGDIINVDIDDLGAVTLICKNDEEKEKKRSDNSSRLRSLFSRGGADK